MSSASTVLLVAPASASDPVAAERSLRPAPQRVISPPRKLVLAASAPWVGGLLNLLPGLGAGYLYQRRWRAWWITTLVATLWSLGLLLLLPVPPQGAASFPAGGTLGMAGLLLLSVLSAAEAFLAARKARHD